LTEPFGLLIEVLVGQIRFPCLEHMASEADDLDGLVGEPDAALDRVGEADQPRDLIEHPDVDDLRVEDLLDPIPDEVIARLMDAAVRAPSGGNLQPWHVWVLAVALSAANSSSVALASSSSS
jgi:hypothetical protein